MTVKPRELDEKEQLLDLDDYPEYRACMHFTYAHYSPDDFAEFIKTKMNNRRQHYYNDMSMRTALMGRQDPMTALVDSRINEIIKTYHEEHQQWFTQTQTA